MEHVDHILIVDDDREIREMVGSYLKKNGLRTTVVADGRQMRSFLEATPVDLIVLDIMMPGDDGLVLCRDIRAGKHKATPVLMLTARNDETDRIIGLEMGADDYLVKPFEFPELLARVRTLMRRSEHIPQPEVFRVSDLELDPRRHRAYRGTRRIDLTTKEFALLQVLMRQAGEVLTRTQIISLVWDMNFDCDTNVVEVSISRLRAKVDDQSEVKLIHTIRGVGYVLEARP